jgi:hypothetical protein
MELRPFDTFRNEWRVVKTAPWSFAAVVIAAAAIGFGVASLWWSGTVSTLRERVTLYQDRLQVGSPEQALQKFNELEAQVKALQPMPQRHLTEEQRTKLLEAIKPIASQLQNIAIFAEAAREPGQFAVDFLRLFKDAGLNPTGPFISFPNYVTEHGILVGLRDPAKPSDLAAKFMEILRSADLHIETTQGPGSGNLDFDLFVCAY